MAFANNGICPECWREEITSSPRELLQCGRLRRERTSGNSLNGALVITHRRREIINLLPAGLSGPRGINQSRASDVTGIAVVEPESK